MTTLATDTDDASTPYPCMAVFTIPNWIHLIVRGRRVLLRH